MFIACNSKPNKSEYRSGAPVIIKKEYSLIPGVCMFTYEGYNRKEVFEDKCRKYSVGDTLNSTR